MKRLHEITGAVARFWEPLEPLRRGRRLGPVLWQLPESFQRNAELLAAALDELPRASHRFEFRHPSWFAAPVRQLLEERGASLAIGDDRRRPLPSQTGGGLAYLRLHYGHPAVATVTTPMRSSTAGDAVSPPGARGARSSSI